MPFTFEIRCINQEEFATKYTEHLNRIAKRILQPDLLLQEQRLSARERGNNDCLQRAPCTQKASMQAKETTPDITLPFRQCRHYYTSF